MATSHVQFSVEGVVVDYEKALWKATRQVLEDVVIRGCAFHWGQAVWRQIQKFGLATQYFSDKGTHAFLRKLLCLPFIPAEHVPTTFNAMAEFNTCDAILPLMEYIERQWPKSSVWSVAEWNVFGQSVRTNNDVEGWHRRLNNITGVSPSFYVLLRILHQEPRYVTEQVYLVGEMCLRRMQRKTHREAQAKLFAAWDSYREGSLSTTALLKTVSSIYTHKTPVDGGQEDTD